MPVKVDRSVVWTPRGVGATILNLMSEHRQAAGRRLVALREARGWNQEDLAHRASLSVKTISRFENGRHDGRKATVRALAGALGVTEADIMGEAPAPLGLGGESQLDRIESMLGELLALLKRPDDSDIRDLAKGLRFDGAEDNPQAASEAPAARQARPRRPRKPRAA